MLLWSVAGCGPGEERVGPEPRTRPLRNRDVSGIAQGSNAFAFDLYKEIARRDGNLFFSPHSISTALAMTYAGARGETARQMARTLRFQLDGHRLHAACGALMRDLNARADPGAFELRTANALWGQRSEGWLESFTRLIRQDYGAPLREVDFERDPDGAAREINAWVERETRERIRDLVGPGAIGPLTQLVLANAIYFKGDWLTAFSEHATHDAPFRLAGGGEVKARMMFRSGGFWYVGAVDVQVLEIPYRDGDLSMMILLPRSVDGLPALERWLTSRDPALESFGGSASDVLAARRWQRVLVHLPRFTFTCDFSLAETLAAMGMPLAFDDQRADFSGMNGNANDLFISKVLHKAFVEVTERGTEAAAASAVMMEPACAGPPERREPPVFRADHPFMFFIRDRRTGAVLFMGRVVNPNAPAGPVARAGATPAVGTDAEKAKAALVGLVRSDRGLFIGNPDPDRLATLPVPRDASVFSLGAFWIDSGKRTYHAKIGAEGPEPYLYEGVFTVEATGEWRAERPQLTRLHRMPR
jgi:serpin B